METSQRPSPSSEALSLLRSYRWQRVPQHEGKDLGLDPNPASESGTSRRRRRLQKWKISQSQPERELPEQLQPPQESRAASKRSVFQRAFSTPAKMPKAQGGSSKMSLRKYLRSMSHRKHQDNTLQESKETANGDGAALQSAPMASAVTPEVPLWDVANVSLLDQQLVVSSKEEEVLAQNRKRASSSVSESSSVYPLGIQRDCAEMSTDGQNALDSDAAERRPFQEASSGTQHSNVKKMLWRRIRDRKGRTQARTDSSSALAVNGDREVLPGPSLLLNLANEKDVVIRPLHSSLSGGRYCFEVLSPRGHHCFSCASAAERTRWMEDLRRVVQPSMDNCERIERMLSLWIYEARDLSPRKRYLCELRLDKVLYGRTTVKQASPTGTIFWGEHFDLKTLPPATELEVSLVLEEERQQQKSNILASMSVPLQELEVPRQPVERWYSLGKDKPSLPTIRIRGRYCSIRVLPIVQYKEFAEYITFHYQELCAGLEHSLSARDKEELTGVLVRVLQSTGKAKDFLIDLGVAELDRFDERESLIFRENTLATKAIDEYMKLVGGPYLLTTLSDTVVQLYLQEDSCEVDPSKCAPCDLADNRSNLQHICEEIFQRIAMSNHSFPSELSEIFAAWQEACWLRGKSNIGQRLISASLFLRFLCPAIMSPNLFGLTQAYPDDNASRTLTLVAKVIQNLANFTTFGEKEGYMSFMNEFLERNWDSMKSFLNSISSPGNAIHLAAYDDSIDLALELSILHSLLCNIFTMLEETKETLEPLPTILHAIQEGTPVPVCVQLGSNAVERQIENKKPGFMPPRELTKHSPLIKSQSMTSIQKNRGKEEPPAPLHPAKPRSKVHRTQSVPTQSKASRRLQKQHSTENMVDDQDSGLQSSNTYSYGGSSSEASQGHSKLRPLASLPRKPTVPWLRHSEDAAATQNGLNDLLPWEQYGKQMEALQAELSTAREKQQCFEKELERIITQNQVLLEEQSKFHEHEETLFKKLQETESCLVQLSSRVSGIEANWKKDHEKLQISEEKAKHLERRLSGMERDHDQLLRAVSQMLGYRGKQSNSLQRQLSGPIWVNRTENGDDA